MSNVEFTEMSIITDSGVAKSWIAWLESKPPVKLFVAGIVQCSNPGIVPELSRIEPQGINPQILLLRLDFVQRPGVWPQVIVDKTVKYEEIPALQDYDEVEVLLNGQSYETIKVSKL